MLAEIRGGFWLDSEKIKRVWAMALLLVTLTCAFAPTCVYADNFSGGGFESRMENLQSKFINVVLPLMSIFGLVYAAIIAASGNEGAKGRITVVVIGSIIGFLAHTLLGGSKES